MLNPGPSHVMNYEDRCFYIAISSEEDTAFKAYKEPKEPVSLFKGSFRQKNDSFITASSVALELRTDVAEPGIRLPLYSEMFFFNIIECSSNCKRNKLRWRYESS